MRLGKIYIPTHYVVDLDAENMVHEAKDCMFEDLINAVKYNELADWVTVVEDSSLSEADIPDFLKDDDEIYDDPIDIIVSSYEWECPHCETLNKEIELNETVMCSNCYKHFHVTEYCHTYGNH